MPYARKSLEEIDRCIGAGMIGLGDLYTQVRINDTLYYRVVEKCIELKISVLCLSMPMRKDARDPRTPRMVPDGQIQQAENPHRLDRCRYPG